MAVLSSTCDLCSHVNVIRFFVPVNVPKNDIAAIVTCQQATSRPEVQAPKANARSYRDQEANRKDKYEGEALRSVHALNAKQ